MLMYVKLQVGLSSLQKNLPHQTANDAPFPRRAWGDYTVRGVWLWTSWEQKIPDGKSFSEEASRAEGFLLGVDEASSWKPFS
jgi:hypothetical protein